MNKKSIIVILAIIVVILLITIGCLAMNKAKLQENNQLGIGSENLQKGDRNGMFKSGDDILKGNRSGDNMLKGNRSGEEMRGGGMPGGGMTNKAEDAKLQAILTEVESKFKQLEYEDKETNITLSYNLFVPDNYDENKIYPLVLFMTDSSVVGKETKAALEQGYGGVIWATAEEQAKHECFVLVPEFAVTIVNDNSETTNDVKAVVNLVNSLTSEYKIDTNRIYTTGQSMGGMTSIYLLKTYPDLFAGALLVACQWSTEGLEVLKDQNIFYIVAEGDTKASPGQDEIKTKLESNGALISTATWDATWDEEEFSKAVNSILSENNHLNFVKFEKGTVLEANPVSSQEHMASFDCAYKIEGIRDWLFEQTK